MIDQILDIWNYIKSGDWKSPDERVVETVLEGRHSTESNSIITEFWKIDGIHYCYVYTGLNSFFRPLPIIYRL